MGCQIGDLEFNKCSVLNVLFYWYHSIAGAISATKGESGKVESVINQFSLKWCLFDWQRSWWQQWWYNKWSYFTSDISGTAEVIPVAPKFNNDPFISEKNKWQ